MYNEVYYLLPLGTRVTSCTSTVYILCYIMVHAASLIKHKTT